MSAKRSRHNESNFIEKDSVESARDVYGSSSQVMNPPSKCLKPTLEEYNKVKSTPPSHGSKNRGFEDYLKYCHFCAKKIDEDKDLYMYRDMGAFCTEECRSFQMKQDKKQQQEYEKAKKMVARDENEPMFH